MEAYGSSYDAKLEPLLKSNPNRFVIFPIDFSSIWEQYKNQVSLFWVPEEIDLSHDQTDWDKLSVEEQLFLKQVLAFFAASDGIVSENLAVNFAHEVQIPEARFFYGFQIAMENIHSETYSNLLEFYIKDDAERLQHLRAIDHMPAIQQKAQWAMRYLDGSLPFPLRLAAFAVVEGIFFSGSFCAIFWLKSRGLLPGLTFSNELISRDEGMHCDFACSLYSMCQQRVPDEVMHDLFREAVSCEVAFIEQALPQNLIGMNAMLMKQYIGYVADRLLKQLGYEPLFGSTNPFSFMNLSSLRGKTNFFEKKVGEYAKVPLAAPVSQAAEWFSAQSDF